MRGWLRPRRRHRPIERVSDASEGGAIRRSVAATSGEAMSRRSVIWPTLRSARVCRGASRAHRRAPAVRRAHGRRCLDGVGHPRLQVRVRSLGRGRPARGGVPACVQARPCARVGLLRRADRHAPRRRAKRGAPGACRARGERPRPGGRHPEHRPTPYACRNQGRRRAARIDSLGAVPRLPLDRARGRRPGTARGELGSDVSTLRRRAEAGRAPSRRTSRRRWTSTAASAR